MAKLILASGSPYRKQLLEQIGIPFDVVPARVDERQLEKEFTGPISELAQHLALAKAQQVFENHPHDLILGSDQVLIFEDQALAKPENLAQAQERLKILNGKTHELHTAFTLIDSQGAVNETLVARLTMSPLTDNEIKNYVMRDQPIGCAGGYKIELRGPALFTEIQTPDYYSIIGLPLLSLCQHLKKRGILRL